jgi:hypothetical protein
MRPTGAAALSGLRYHSGRPTDSRHHRENLTCPPKSTSTRSASGSAWASSRAQVGRSPLGSSGGSSPRSERKHQRDCNLFDNLPVVSALLAVLATCQHCWPAGCWRSEGRHPSITTDNKSGECECPLRVIRDRSIQRQLRPMSALVRKRTNAGAAGLSAMCQKQTHALQHDRRKKKDRQCSGLSKIRSGVLVKANDALILHQ